MTTPTLEKIQLIANKLATEGILQHGQGFCFAMAELTQYLLKEQGVESSLVECELTLMRRNPPGLKLIGQENEKGTPSSFDSHMVCVTETDPMYLIDFSVLNGMVTLADRTDGKLIAVNDDGNTKLIYREKDQPKYPPILNRNIIQRMRSDLEQRKTIKWLKVMVVSLLVITSLNLLRGAYTAYETWVTPDNYWGPETLRRLDQKIDNLTEQVNKQPKR